MNKTAWIRLILWSILALALIAILVTGIVTKPSSGLFSGGFSFGIGMDTYRHADRYTVGGGSVSEPVTALDIHWVSGSVTLEPYDGETVEITETPEVEEDNRLRYLVENGRLTVQYKKSGWFFGFYKTPKKNLTVRLPQAMADALQSVEIDSVSAKLSVSDLVIDRQIELDTVSGTMLLNRVTAGQLNIDTVSGAPTLTNCTFDQLEYDAVSGDLSITGSAIRELESDTTSGKVEAALAEMPQKADFDTVSGDVTLAVRECRGFHADFDTVSGDFNSDFNFSAHDGDYRFGDGSSDLSFDSTSGDFTIRKLTPAP